MSIDQVVGWLIATNVAGATMTIILIGTIVVSWRRRGVLLGALHTQQITLQADQATRWAGVQADVAGLRAAHAAVQGQVAQLHEQVRTLQRSRVMLLSKLRTIEEIQAQMLTIVQRLDTGEQVRSAVRQELTTLLNPKAGGTEINVGRVMSERDSYLGSSHTE